MSKPKGQRSEPNSYLSDDYIANHLAKFDDGAVRIASLSAVKEYGTLGPNGAFVMPKKDFDSIIQKSNGNLSKIESYLGLNKNSLSDSE